MDGTKYGGIFQRSLHTKLEDIGPTYDLLEYPIKTTDECIAILKFCYNTQQDSDFGEARMEFGAIL